ncbi:hypothetical protein BKA81DRAFT_374245 [Phyllosticta paracitricarpa]
MLGAWPPKTTPFIFPPRSRSCLLSVQTISCLARSLPRYGIPTCCSVCIPRQHNILRHRLEAFRLRSACCNGEQSCSCSLLGKRRRMLSHE